MWIERTSWITLLVKVISQVELCKTCQWSQIWKSRFVGNGHTTFGREMCSNQAQSIDTGKSRLWSQKWWWWTGAMSRGEVDGFSFRALAKVQNNPGQLPPPFPFSIPFLLFFSLVLSVLSRFCRASLSRQSRQLVELFGAKEFHEYLFSISTATTL